MEINEYGSVKLLQFSTNITTDELQQCVDVLDDWAKDGSEYAIIAHIPKGGKSVQDLTSISKIFRTLKGSNLRIYGVRSGPISSFIANIVGQLLDLKMNEAQDYDQLIKKIKKDNPTFSTDIETYSVAEKMKSLN